MSKHIGVSPSGKASDSESDISLVRIQVPQPFPTNTSSMDVFFCISPEKKEHIKRYVLLDYYSCSKANVFVVMSQTSLGP